MNLILLNCHDLGRQLACYGHADVISPNLDTFADEAILFEKCFATAPQCSPSRSALFTGRYPHNNGMMGLAHPPFNWKLNSGEKHLAQLLRDASYQTGHIGVEHVSYTVDETHALGYEQVHRCTDSDQIVQESIAYLEQFAGSERPFFLNVGFFDPHRDAQGKYWQAPRLEDKQRQIPAYLPDNEASQLEFAELYGVIKQMDAAVGQILTAVKRLGLLEDTIIVFTTDHGLAMPRAKCTLYDAGLEIALLLWAPQLELPGQRVAELISNVDIVPSLLEALGVTSPLNLQGQSFWPLLLGGDHKREYIFAEKTFHTAYEPQRAIRSERYKLIWNAEVDITNIPGDILRSRIYPHMIGQLWQERPIFELYDLQADPLEQNNLADHPAYQQVAKDLRNRLLAFLQETDDPLLQGPVGSPYYRQGINELSGD